MALYISYVSFLIIQKNSNSLSRVVNGNKERNILKNNPIIWQLSVSIIKKLRRVMSCLVPNLSSMHFKFPEYYSLNDKNPLD